ncbi:hypothetical protein HPULCUR_006458 [Helicostylum pulchrum]|uniref:Uncharacterized protein n=1 Tax=Helicostylum pulchrum TaxID=562976 RepID=A0ABP9Y2K9_9FUNG
MFYLKENDSTAGTTTPNSPSTRFQPESTHQFMELDKVVSTTSAALDSDNIPNDAVIDNNDHRLITSDINSSTNPLTTNDLHTCVTPTEENFGTFDREVELNDDDFGNFDSDQDDDGFGSFDDECFDETGFNTLPEPEHMDNTPVFSTLQEALEIWANLLNQLYTQQPLENFTQSSSKSIRHYVLEEAPESLHSRLTWDSVTRHMDNDTGIPKVRWYLSEIEKLHLNALSCQRSTKLPTIVNTTDHKPDPIDTSWSNNDLITPTATNYQPSPIEYNSNTATTTPTSEKRSSVFGLSSLSRYLPHLSKTNLPRSPTSPISPSSSFHSTTTIPKDRTSYEHSLSSPPSSSPLSLSDKKPKRSNTTSDGTSSFAGAFNHMNIQTKTSHKLKSTTTTPSHIKRSNTVAFSSRFSSPILDISSSPPSPTAVLSSTLKPRPTSFHTTTTNQQPLDLFDLNVEPDSILKSPITSEFNTSFKPLIPTFSSTPLSPTTMYSPAATTPVVVADDDFGDFGSFAVQKDTATTATQDPFGDFFTDNNSKKPSVKKAENEDDPFGLNSVMQMSASNIKPKPVVLKPSSDMMLSPTKVSPTIVDYNTKLASMFDVPAVSDQTEEDDWGDWTF